MMRNDRLAVLNLPGLVRPDCPDLLNPVHAKNLHQLAIPDRFHTISLSMPRHPVYPYLDSQYSCDAFDA